ncbi:M15 family metallopeptidase [Polaribacter sp.]|uniref:M15 family metallopeptidase n=1 Tax=Polaribacter sp. TaxID=1920175 RepID=UPI003EF42A47
MGFSKVLIKLVIVVFFLGFFNCSKKEKAVKIAIKTSEVLKKKDTVLLFPKYLNENYVLGKFDYTKNLDFVLVPQENASKKIYVRKEVLAAFLKMNSAAKAAGVSFQIISGTRNFAHQKRIWNYKWNEKYKNIAPLERAKKILEFSSMPSTSRHHWGTDIDINNLNNAYFKTGKGLKEYQWLLKNAHTFGFYQVYTSKEQGRTGYNEEKWHWSYVPLSSLYLKFYNSKVNVENINGFEGFSYAEELHVIKEYVNGINPEILKTNSLLK